MKLAIIMTVALSVHSAFEYGSGDPEALFPYQYAVQDVSSPACVMNPALLPGCSGLLMSAAAGKPYSGYGLDSRFSAVQYSGGQYGISCEWNSFGCGFYREDSFSAGAGYAPLRWMSAGVRGDIYMLDIDTGDGAYRDISCDWGAGIVIIPAGWFQAGALCNNINTLRHENHLRDFAWSCGLLLKPCRGLSVSWNISSGTAGSINTFIIKVSPFKHVSTGFGYSPETSSFSALLGIKLDRVGISYSIRSHPYLGYSHAISVSYNSCWNIETLNYGRLSFSHEKRININTVDYGGLMELGFLSSRSARRIILYREKAGPLSRDALVAIGLLPEEIRELAAVSYGFEKDSHSEKREKTADNSRKKKKIYVPRKERVKNLFRQMIDEGIPAYQAALYSDLSQSDRALFLEKLQADDSLSDEQKKIIRRLCGK